LLTRSAGGLRTSLGSDAQIAAICRTVDATLATRNTDDYRETGLQLINPWKLG
jgi:predicted nucleic acid-binding protein